MEKKFEDCMEELSSVVSQLQKEETPLEEMLVQYKKGTEAAMSCLTISKETERDIHDISLGFFRYSKKPREISCISLLK